MNKVTLSKFLLLCGDFISFFCSLFIALYLLFFFGEGQTYFPIEDVDNYVMVHLSTALVCVGWFWVRLRHYTYRKPFWFELKEILRTLVIFFVIELSIIALSKLYVSRTFWILTWSIIFFLTPIIRIFLKKSLIKFGGYKKDTVIIGTGANAKEVYKALSDETYLGFNLRYFVSSDSIKEDEINGVSIINVQGQDLLKLLDIDKENIQFILALDNESTLDFWLRYLAKNKCRSVSVIPNMRGIPLYGTDMSFLFSHEMLLLRINNNLAKRSSRILKRMMDLVGSISIIILLSPVLLTLYFLIKKDGGNAIYGHRRIGQNGKPFDCLKFRSMVVNSKEVLEELLATNPEARAEWEKDFKLKNDPRITKVGAFIRKTSLDELPQLFNVLKGEMSLVGPRPIIKDELERYDQDVDYYLMAKPGMTGLWQVSGRNDVDYDTRVYFDSWYVKNWSLWNDIAILFKTVNVVLNRNGAY
ncbi:undecaprenyl-phosphate galactose phosphotransferase WbaP [Actinobacillus equuli]|uniref:Sugar transferase n=1 Tax=Actinobacillus equuli TaxID=718 RepID=A0AAX3FJC3_ACTEU|nr:undecaprenyl-phosphate galactose phosphotransferase WbaP [Actinobacillus equuli]AIZ80237.1 UDP-phosphate galactose phosphotransferase [Actinobacillus equuli subsp. equuli]WGE44344.1 undecaprenyl-phosphate galactose phosphotransferase WbaP [Actinobacillus equuli subsp. equuli]VEE91553.1 sugar transferase [Actinobacillus equuli]